MQGPKPVVNAQSPANTGTPKPVKLPTARMSNCTEINLQFILIAPNLKLLEANYRSFDSSRIKIILIV